jgi:3-dehydroquinate dehydratase
MICVSIGRGRHRHVIAEHRHLAENGVPLVELRLDYIQGTVQVKRLLAERPCPVIVTCRRVADGGRWEQSEDDRLMLLRTAIERMAAGQIDAMVVQNPFEMGIQTVRLLLAMHDGDEATIKEMFPRFGEPDGDIYTTGLRLIVPDTDPLVKPADIQGSDHEYMPLSTFRSWLATYGLSSS